MHCAVNTILNSDVLWQGNAKILNSTTNDDLEQTLHLSDQQYLVVLMVFLVSYTVFKVPSCYLLKKFRPSRWYDVLFTVQLTIY